MKEETKTKTVQSCTYEDFLDLLRAAQTSGAKYIEVTPEMMKLCCKHVGVDLAGKNYYMHSDVRIYLEGTIADTEKDEMRQY